MGIGPIALGVYKKIPQVWRSSKSIMELGAQDIFLTDASSLDFLFDMRGMPRSSVGMKSSRCLMEHLGFDYDCLDLNGENGAIVADLNTPLVMSRQYDIVTNHGTTEHVFDQATCFSNIHNFTRKRGTMIHVNPVNGFNSHGLFNYQPQLFRQMAEDNRYWMEGMWLAFDLTSEKLSEWNGEHITGDSILCVVMTKTRNRPFIQPYQMVERPR